jgi:hypothetical protein
LNNSSQLAGFAKCEDLTFFLEAFCGAEYLYEPMLAPTRDMLDAYRKGKVEWIGYEKRFIELMRERQVEKTLDKRLFETPTVLLCSEATPERCHRRLVLEYLDRKWGDIQAVHL